MVIAAAKELVVTASNNSLYMTVANKTAQDINHHGYMVFQKVTVRIPTFVA